MLYAKIQSALRENPTEKILFHKTAYLIKILFKNLY
jgi:hypothetical protein